MCCKNKLRRKNIMKNINFISTILGLVFPVIGILLTVLYKSDNRITVLFFILFLLYEIPILIKRFLFYKKERVNPNLKNLIRTEYSMSIFSFWVYSILGLLIVAFAIIYLLHVSLEIHYPGFIQRMVNSLENY